mmetsp:Transcript_23113/g.54995  ORF Transcript_23113/g.54995 Transcript_23113/m.54995 type:complete len:244 (-) Transcript_23113:2143-2874(-)
MYSQMALSNSATLPPWMRATWLVRSPAQEDTRLQAPNTAPPSAREPRLGSRTRPGRPPSKAGTCQATLPSQRAPSDESSPWRRGTCSAATAAPAGSSMQQRAAGVRRSRRSTRSISTPSTSSTSRGDCSFVGSLSRSSMLPPAPSSTYRPKKPSDDAPSTSGRSRSHASTAGSRVGPVDGAVHRLNAKPRLRPRPGEVDRHPMLLHHATFLLYHRVCIRSHRPEGHRPASRVQRHPRRRAPSR